MVSTDLESCDVCRHFTRVPIQRAGCPPCGREHVVCPWCRTRWDLSPNLVEGTLEVCPESADFQVAPALGGNGRDE